MKMALHWKILLGMLLGVIYGILFVMKGWDAKFVIDWIKPFGTIFIKLLKLIAIPLIIASLIKGVSDLKDISKFSQIGGRTILIYVLTTLMAVSIGLVVVNIIDPGERISPETLEMLSENYAGDANKKIEDANKQQQKGPLSFVEDMVPDNIFGAASSNRNMLQVIFFVILFAISLLLIDAKKAEPVKAFFDGLNDVVLKMVDLIMLMAPFAVFALLASLIVETKSPDLLIGLLWYGLAVVVGLLLMVCIYLLIIKFYVKRSPIWFLKNISPAQLLAFSTSSSAATLPVTMERVEEHLGVEKEVSSFVLPVGATINMDGTSLYQAVAAIFITQALNFQLDFSDQLTIILTATLASIGSAAVPGAGMVMLVIVLEALDVPQETLAIGLALIFAIDRPLDMCRTVINVTGDATVAMIVGKSVNKLSEPNPKNWDDHLDKVR